MKDPQAPLPNKKLGYISASCWSVEFDNPFSLAILKDGKLIGIQSSAYTVNAKDVGEIPLGLISFHLVWKNQIKNLLK